MVKDDMRLTSGNELVILPKSIEITYIDIKNTEAYTNTTKKKYTQDKTNIKETIHDTYNTEVVHIKPKTKHHHSHSR